MDTLLKLHMLIIMRKAEILRRQAAELREELEKEKT